MRSGSQKESGNRDAKTGRISKTKTDTRHEGTETDDAQRPRQTGHSSKIKTEPVMFPFKMASINSLLAPATSSGYPPTNKGNSAAPLKSTFSIQSILAESKKVQEKCSEGDYPVSKEMKHNNNHLRDDVVKGGNDSRPFVDDDDADNDPDSDEFLDVEGEELADLDDDDVVVSQPVRLQSPGTYQP